MITNLKEIRISKGITQNQLAKLIGYDQTIISQWEHGSRDPNTEALMKLSEVLCTPIDLLLGNKAKKAQADGVLIKNATLTQNVYKEMRNKMQLTQKELASKLHLNQGTISKWEQGKSFPDTGTLINLAELFNCTIDELVGRNPHINADAQTQLHEGSNFDKATPAQEELIKKVLESSDTVCIIVSAYLNGVSDMERAADLVNCKNIKPKEKEC